VVGPVLSARIGRLAKLEEAVGSREQAALYSTPRMESGVVWRQACKHLAACVNKNQHEIRNKVQVTSIAC